MSNKKQTAATEAAMLPEPTETQVSLNIDASTFLATKEALKSLKNFKHEIELTAEYLKFEQGEEGLYVYAGLEEIDSAYGENGRLNANGRVDCVRLMGEDGKFYITAAAVIVGTLRNMKPATPVKIACTGEVRGKEGKYQQFSIK